MPNRRTAILLQCFLAFLLATLVLAAPTSALPVQSHPAPLLHTAVDDIDTEAGTEANNERENDKDSNDPNDTELATEYAHHRVILDYLTESSSADTLNTAIAKAKEGWKVLGGGASTRLSDEPASNLLTGSFPVVDSFGNATAWSAAARGPDVEATAVVLYDPQDQWDVKVFSAETTVTASDVDADKPITVSVALTTGYTLTGAGAQLEDGSAGRRALIAVRIDNSTTGNSVTVVASAPCDVSLAGGQNSTSTDVARAAAANGGATTLKAFVIGVRPRNSVASITSHIVKAVKNAAVADSVDAQVTAVGDAVGCAVTTVDAELLLPPSAACSAGLDMLRPGTYGEEGEASAVLGGIDAELRVSAVLVDEPRVFY